MTLTRYKNVLHPRHEMFKIASVSRAPPQTPLGELTTLCRPLVVRGFLPSVAAASRLRRLQFHRLASGCGVRLSDPAPYLEALASPLVKFYFAPHGLRPNSAYGSVTFTLRIHKRPGHPGSPDVLSANRSLLFRRYSEACVGRVEGLVCQVYVYFRSYSLGLYYYILALSIYVPIHYIARVTTEHHLAGDCL